MKEIPRDNSADITSQRLYLNREGSDPDTDQSSNKSQTLEKAQASKAIQTIGFNQQLDQVHDLMDQSLFPSLILVDLADLDQRQITIWISQQLFYRGGKTKEEADKIAGQWMDDGETLKTATMTRLMVAFGNEDCFCIDACRSATRGVVRKEPWEHICTLKSQHP